MKLALFCPRLSNESPEAWQQRLKLCRLYLRSLPCVEALEFETLEHLETHYGRHLFRRVLVARSGYYPLAFWDWVRQNRTDVQDVLLRPAETPRPEPRLSSVHRPSSARIRPLSARPETLARCGTSE